MTSMGLGLTSRGAPRKRKYAANRVAWGTPPSERIKHHVVVDGNGCWIWQISTDNGSGYGQITIDHKVYKAHRVSYEAFVGPIPTGLQLDHLCRVRKCVNPEHLEPVTPLENTHRGVGHGSETECPQGHEYSPENTYVTTANRRHCRTCRAAYGAIFRSLTPEERAARKADGLPVVDLAAYFQTQQVAA